MRIASQIVLVNNHAFLLESTDIVSRNVHQIWSLSQRYQIDVHALLDLSYTAICVCASLAQPIVPFVLPGLIEHQVQSMVNVLVMMDIMILDRQIANLVIRRAEHVLDQILTIV